MNAKKILITGGNRGIGKAMAIQLVEAGHQVVITSRSLESGEAAATEVRSKTAKDHIQVIQGDLSSIAQCRDLANRIKSEHSDIDVLINNAGVLMVERELNPDGLEMSFMVNYLGTYIMCTELLETLQSKPGSRIVNINAGLYMVGKFNLDTIPSGENFHPIKTYGNSKLCGILFGIDFAEQIKGTNTTINSVHPGVIRTGLGDSDKLVSKIVNVVKRLWKKPEKGAEAPVWLATSPDLEGISGNYYDVKKLSPYTHKDITPANRKALKEYTEALLNKRV